MAHPLCIEDIHFYLGDDTLAFTPIIISCRYHGEPASIAEWCEVCDHLSDHVLLTRIGGGAESDPSTEDALAELWTATSDDLREASLDRVLSAAERGVQRQEGFAPGNVIVIDGAQWELRAALSALRDKELGVGDILAAITSEE